MQGSSSSSAAQPEAILEWLHKEMGYRPLGSYGGAASGKSQQLPSIDAVRKICRGNMIPIWSFLITRVKSESTVKNIRRNITVHGDSGAAVKVEGRRRRKEKGGGESSSAAEVREAAVVEREAAEKEVEKLRSMVKRQRKDLKARMLEVSRAEAERKRMLDERSKKR